MRPFLAGPFLGVGGDVGGKMGFEPFFLLVKRNNNRVFVFQKILNRQTVVLMTFMGHF